MNEDTLKLMDAQNQIDELQHELNETRLLELSVWRKLEQARDENAMLRRKLEETMDQIVLLQESGDE